MKKFQTMAGLTEFFNIEEYPQEFQETALNAMKSVENYNRYVKGNYPPSYLLIADTETESALIEKEYVLSGCTPESDVCITTVGGKCWRERVFVFGDAGDGVIYYERVPLLCEKRAEL